jgi:hypothetical protein
MQDDNNSQQQIRIPVTRVNAAELIDQLADENFRLRQENDELKRAIDKLANMVVVQNDLIQQLRDEIAILKGQKPKPKIPPSQLEGQKSKQNWRGRIKPYDSKETILFSMWVNRIGKLVLSLPVFFATKGATTASELAISQKALRIIKKVRRVGKPGQPRGKHRKKKKTLLTIHDRPVIEPDNIPKDAVFKGYQKFTVQDIIFKTHNTQYQLARYQLPDGSYIRGELPKDIHGHYGPDLIAHILQQYHGCRVPEELLLKDLHFRGVLMSEGQLSNILTQNKEKFHAEAGELLAAGTQAENELKTDDTGGRHKGKNQYTTIIGNRWFSVFTTTDSKSKINFLKLLQGGKEEYVINKDTVQYLIEASVAGYLHGYIAFNQGCKFTSAKEWEQFLKDRNITAESEKRIVTEAALYASVIEHGIPRDLGVHSDDAGQFDVFVHSLCWIHEERHYRKLVMTTDQSRAELGRVREQIWEIYQALKGYKDSPSQAAKQALEKQFNDIFQQETSSPTLNKQLKKTYRKKEELLRAIERPATPLHNNSSETDARAAKIKLKVSGGTRSDLGKQARDTFLSLKQTCLKLGINFISFLQDRVRGLYLIPRLADIIRQRSFSTQTTLTVNSS